MNTAGKHHRQCGAVLITVALTLLFLLGFMGIALDLGHMFVVKTELQTALDSCALAAAQELDGRTDALTRAASAGVTAGNLNRVDFQSATWNGQGLITAGDVTFKDASYTATTSAATARYAQCSRTQPGVRMWLLNAMGAFSGNTANYPGTRSVVAMAVATRASTQSTCPLPIGLKPKAGGTAPNYGFQIGEWVTLYGDRVPGSGEMGWYNLDGSTSASETRSEMNSPTCGIRVGDTLGTPGAQTTINKVWNYRFGIYGGSGFDTTDTTQYPDYSGYSYTSTNWKNAVPQNAWSGSPAAGSDPTAANFLTKRVQFASYDDTGTDVKDGSRIVFNDKNRLNGYNALATPGTTGQHARYGSSRRIALVPILDGGSHVIDYACMFMLQPMTGPQDPVQLEFRGNASAQNSPCTTSGIPGGTAGPLVPVLVQ